ncbi:aspartate-semialdehyde dehydrogenase [Bradyrhizobium sp. UFLA01-814]|uniref:aspartate-semialdehyde dehydrogenase n=1 Tax=Bradyrhizobium sp. UFLA01-814 TaxID=3023480 RepID=UPI00398AA2B3
MSPLKIAIVGATGAVGAELIKLLEESRIPVSQLGLIASSRSAGRQITFRGGAWPVDVIEGASNATFDLVFFSAGGAISLEWAPRFAASGALVIDNSNAFRMNPDVPLIVPQVNSCALTSRPNRGIVANPNCSTIQLVRAIRPLVQALAIRQIVLTTYQAASGGGLRGINELLTGSKSVLDGTDESSSQRFPVSLAFNVIPQVGELSDDGVTLEERKLIQESRKIFSLPELKLTATCVRVPVTNGHSEAVYIESSECVSLNYVRELLSREQGIQLYDHASCRPYPTPRLLEHHGDVHVGRIRVNPDDGRGLWMWVVANNLQVGAALNAVQIAELAVRNRLVGEKCT